MVSAWPVSIASFEERDDENHKQHTNCDLTVMSYSVKIKIIGLKIRVVLPTKLASKGAYRRLEFGVDSSKKCIAASPTATALSYISGCTDTLLQQASFCEYFCTFADTV